MKSQFELHHQSPKCKSGTLTPHRHQVKHSPGLTRGGSVLAVALETDSNTVARSSLAEEIVLTVFAICKMISWNFKRKAKR